MLVFPALLCQSEHLFISLADYNGKHIHTHAYKAWSGSWSSHLQTKCTWCSPSPLYAPHPAPACALEPWANRTPPPDPASVTKPIRLASMRQRVGSYLPGGRERGGCWEEPGLSVYTWIRQSRRAEHAAAMQTRSSQRHTLSALHRCSPWQLELPVLGWALQCRHIRFGPLDCCWSVQLGRSGTCL